MFPKKCNMKLFALGIMAILMLPSCFSKSASRPENTLVMEGTSDFYSFSMKDIKGEMIDFSSFKGKKVLIVNVASECGFTPQYEDLQALHEKFPELVILGFPANDFGGQEPGSDEEIASFCSSKFNVDFTMMSKITVKGDNQPELYKWLTTKGLNGWNEDAPNWNFCK